MGEDAAMRRLEEWLKDAAWGCYFPPGTAPWEDCPKNILHEIKTFKNLL